MKSKCQKKKPVNMKLKFLDMKTKKTFYSGSYRHVTKGKTRFAVANNPSGGKSWRILGRK